MDLFVLAAAAVLAGVLAAGEKEVAVAAGEAGRARALGFVTSKVVNKGRYKKRRHANNTNIEKSPPTGVAHTHE